MGKGIGTGKLDRAWLYALCGLFLGVSAPIGWQFFRLLLFWQEGQSAWAQVLGDIFGSAQSLALYTYMGGGTALVLGAFGFLVGRGMEQIHERARNLDELNSTIAEQKEEFERRFRDLNASIKNFHSINAHIQKTVDRKEVLLLSADGLHDVLGYDRVNILMVDKERNVLKLVACRGCDGVPSAEVLVPLDERAGAMYKSFKERRIFFIEDIGSMPEEFHVKPPCNDIPQLRSKTFIICPIVVNGEVIGLFGVDNKTKHKALDDTDVDTVRLFADQVSSSLIKINLLEAVETLTGELEYTFDELLKYRSEHARLDASLKDATASTSEAISDIAGASDVVRDAVDATRSSAGEISVSIDQVSRNLSQLRDFMENSISAITQITCTIKTVQENAVRSHTMSEDVKKLAELGSQTVSETMGGLHQISGAVESAVETISHLSEKGEEIDSITTVITEIAQKTNLLALNAAIIAAQAGEHGRSFAVVADEVRSLSQETARSSGAIATLINEIQESTRESVNHIGKTREMVVQGIALGEGVEVSLRQILGSATPAMEMAHEIRSATQEVARSAESVRDAIENLGEMSSQVSIASNEQAQGTRSIVQSIEEVKSMSDDMAMATERQQRNTKEIEEAVDSVSGMVSRIFAEMEERKEGSRKVIKTLEGLKKGDAVVV